MTRQYTKKECSKLAKAQIESAIESGNDYKVITESLNIPISTVNRWIREGFKEDTRGGARNTKLAVEHIEFFKDLIENNPRITLRELGENLFQKFDIGVSLESIRQHVDGLVYTMKNIRFVPETANSETNKLLRKTYVQSILYYQSGDLPIVYMDETNFNLHVSRTRGRSVKGTRCNVPAASSRGANVHLIGAISCLGPLNFTLRRGSFKMDSAREWVRETIRLGEEKFQSKIVLVLDNAPTHSRIEEVLQEPEFEGNVILRLGPYSPMLNPIEKVWSIIKAIVKSELAAKIRNFLSQRISDVSIREYRMSALEEIIRNSFRRIDAETCNNLIRSVQALFVDCIEMKDVSF